MAARDIIFIAVTLFGVGILGFVVVFAGNKMADGMLNNTEINQSAPTREVFTIMKTNLNRVDSIFLGFFIGFILSLIITGWFVGGHAVFMFIYFIVVFIMVVVSTVLSYVWDQITTASVFGVTIASVPITNHVLSILPVYVAVIGLIGIFVMFAKPTAD